jgi:hypothetical protein
MSYEAKRDSARINFLDDLAGHLAGLIQAGVTEDEIRADFEAQMSLQMWTDERPGRIRYAEPSNWVRITYVELDDEGHAPPDAERYTAVMNQEGWLEVMDIWLHATRTIRVLGAEPAQQPY